MAESVLKAMRVAHVPESSSTMFAVLKGAIIRGTEEEMEAILEEHKLKLNELQLVEIITELGLQNNISWLPEVRIILKQVNAVEYNFRLNFRYPSCTQVFWEEN